MAGEYYRWLAKDVKPEEKKELSREEKLRNWWYYHKWHLLIGAVVSVLVLDLALDVLSDWWNRPDYTVAYVGSSYLPEDTVDQLTEALAGLGEDLTGNGKVQVELNQYIAYGSQSGDPAAQGSNHTMLYAAQAQLAADMESCESYFFLMEDPGQFQEDYRILTSVDGGDPEEASDASRTFCYKWSDCPVLMELPLGSFSVETYGASYSGESRDVLAGLYIGRRGFWQEKTCPYPDGCEALWAVLTEGAPK